MKNGQLASNWALFLCVCFNVSLLLILDDVNIEWDGSKVRESGCYHCFQVFCFSFLFQGDGVGGVKGRSHTQPSMALVSRDGQWPLDTVFEDTSAEALIEIILKLLIQLCRIAIVLVPNVVGCGLRIYFTYFIFLKAVHWAKSCS